jgi:hypothetical protein
MQDNPSLEQIFTLAVATASAELTERGGGQLMLRSLRMRPAAEFPDGAEADHIDVTAGVAQRFRGALRGTSVFSMEPEGALAWSGSVLEGNGSAERVIPTFIELASGILCDLVTTAAHAMHGGSVDFDVANLRESSRVAIVIGTHAPSDTAVGTLGLDVEFDDQAFPAHVDLLLEPKLLPGDWAGPEPG